MYMGMSPFVCYSLRDVSRVQQISFKKISYV